MRALFLTTVLPATRRGGGEVVSQALVEALKDSGHSVRVLGYLRPEQEEQSGETSLGPRPIETAAAGARAIVWMGRALAMRRPYSCAKYESRSYFAAVARELADDPDVAFVDHAQLAFLAPQLVAARVPFVHVAHNAEALLYAALGGTGSRVRRWLNLRESALIAQAERKLAADAVQVWTLTEEDAGYFRSLGARGNVRVLPVSVPPSGPSAEPEYEVALLGNWTWEANRAGLEWFLREVVPQLGADVTVAVGGAGSERLGASDPRVAGHGVVPHASRFLSRARVVVVPSVAGGGAQVKTVDAIATGRWVVATRMAIRGLDDLPETVTVADDPSRFAEGVSIALAAGAPNADAARGWAESRNELFREHVARWLEDLCARTDGLAATGSRSD